jgi:hypothetical protein
MDTIILLLGIASLNTLLINHDLYKKHVPNRKPFICALCMGFWLPLGALIFKYGSEGILYAAITAIVTELLDRKLNTY